MAGFEDAALASRHELERLLANAPAIAALLPAGYLDAAQRFVGQLLSANQRLNLTRVTEPAEIARLHLLDALAALPLLDAWDPGQVIDLGSGGGVPAIPLALARPAVSWTLVDSVAKKARAIERIIEELGLRNAIALADRAEALGRDPRHRGRYDVATARAVAPLPVLAELALPLLRIGGHLLAWKGPLGERDEEMRRGRTAIGEVGGGRPRVVDPQLEALGGHRFVVATKERATPPRFPRHPGEPGRRPLG